MFKKIENAKPCPFCGAEDIRLRFFDGNIIPSAEVFCTGCFAVVKKTNWKKLKKFV